MCVRKLRVIYGHSHSALTLEEELANMDFLNGGDLVKLMFASVPERHHRTLRLSLRGRGKMSTRPNQRSRDKYSGYL